MGNIIIRKETVKTKDSFIKKTLAGPNRMFHQGEGLEKTLITVANIEGSGPGSKASFFTGSFSGEGMVVTSKSSQSASGSFIPITTIEMVK